MKNLIVVILMAVIPVMVVAQPEIKGNPSELRKLLYPNDKIVTITGSAEKKAYSDKAIVNLIVTSEEERLADSIEANRKLRNAIIEQLTTSGITIDNIKNSKFSTSPQFGWFGKKPDSYKVINRMAISIIEENHLKDIATVTDSYKEIELSDTFFEHTKEDEFKFQVKTQALDKIMKKKAHYENTLGVKLLPVGIIDERVGYGATRGAAVYEEVIVTAQKRGRTNDTPRAISARKSTPYQKPSFDEIKYNADITVDFKIMTPAAQARQISNN